MVLSVPPGSPPCLPAQCAVAAADCFCCDIDILCNYTVLMSPLLLTIVSPLSTLCCTPVVKSRALNPMLKPCATNRCLLVATCRAAIWSCCCLEMPPQMTLFRLRTSCGTHSRLLQHRWRRLPQPAHLRLPSWQQISDHASAVWRCRAACCSGTGPRRATLMKPTAV